MIHSYCTTPLMSRQSQADMVTLGYPDETSCYSSLLNHHKLGTDETPEDALNKSVNSCDNSMDRRYMELIPRSS